MILLNIINNEQKLILKKALPNIKLEMYIRIDEWITEFIPITILKKR